MATWRLAFVHPCLNEDVKQSKLLYRTVLSAQVVVTVCLSAGCPLMCSPQYRTHCYCVSESMLSANVFPTVQNTLLLCV